MRKLLCVFFFLYIDFICDIYIRPTLAQLKFNANVKHKAEGMLQRTECNSKYVEFFTSSVMKTLTFCFVYERVTFFVRLYMLFWLISFGGGC